MTYSRQNRMASDAALLEALAITARKGGIVGVHAENDAMCCYLSDRFKAEGRTSPADFPRCKYNLVEAEAVNRAIYLARATGGNLYIFHLSCKESLELLRKARAEGVREGLVSVVSSDHCGFTLANKAVGENDFTRTPNGLPGMETRLAAMYTYGVRSGRLSLPKLVELLSANPARIFGMWPRKGVIAAGSDADLVIFDPEASCVVSPETLHSPVDWNPYGGERLYGRADQVLRRGELIVDGGEFLARPGSGRRLAAGARSLPELFWKAAMAPVRHPVMDGRSHRAPPLCRYSMAIAEDLGSSFLSCLGREIRRMPSSNRADTSLGSTPSPT